MAIIPNVATTYANVANVVAKNFQRTWKFLATSFGFVNRGNIFRNHIVRQYVYCTACCKKYICNMSNAGSTDELERHLLTEMARIERSIARLREEHSALQRTLARVRQQRLGNLAVTRRNSHARLLAENEIVEALRMAPEQTLTTWQLLAFEKGINPDLNPSTFRSHLHRMKNRRLIVPKHGQRGVWTLPSAPKA